MKDKLIAISVFYAPSKVPHDALEDARGLQRYCNDIGIY